jgi:hypothetical protein
VSQVLSELGLQLADLLSGLPQASGSLAESGSKELAVAGASSAVGGGDEVVKGLDAGIQARLDNLNKYNE